ncbi:MAG: Sulfatase [candidate division BRC1 bacterium ADurb.BinA364]|nr:MAG: Sulfatase [candidate division BRC1 bacterium ADurb.BinA364]
MVTGMRQTTLGAHNHRSQNASGKGGGGEAYAESYRLPVKTIPRLFKDAGYFTSNGRLPSQGTAGKTDYNFVWDARDYDGKNWRERPAGQPFFAQFQLTGGKGRSAPQQVDPAAVNLPPYYPDDPVLREDWATYLNAWLQIDAHVGQILDQLEEDGLVETTAVFFWTDHGISHLRGKQFLYDEGVRVPLIARVPGGPRGLVRDDLVMQIDVAAASLALAGIEIPPHVQGRDFLAGGYAPSETIFCARDRCDETVDLIRCARTARFKYIRNFMHWMSHAQPNQYKDGKKILKRLREMAAAGELNELQARPFLPSRPPEELYDLRRDPDETENLAERGEHRALLEEMRQTLFRQMVETGDLGLIPEPILEDEGRKAGNKHFIYRQPENEGLAGRLIAVFEAIRLADAQALAAALAAQSAAERYWAATGLGVLNARQSAEALRKAADDESPAVRVAAALALCRLGEDAPYTDRLGALIDHENMGVSLHAIRALELTGERARRHAAAVRKARQSSFEFTRRIAQRMIQTLQFERENEAAATDGMAASARG